MAIQEHRAFGSDFDVLWAFGAGLGLGLMLFAITESLGGQALRLMEGALSALNTAVWCFQQGALQ